MSEEKRKETSEEERIKRRLTNRYGFTDDELETLFNDDLAKLMEAEKSLSGLERPNEAAERELGFIEEDDYQLSAEERSLIKSRMDVSRRLNELRRKRVGLLEQIPKSPEEAKEAEKPVSDEKDGLDE